MENILQNVIQHRNPDGIDHNVIRGIVLHDIFDIDNPQEENARDNILLRLVFNLEDIDDRDVKLNFRFDRDDIPRLCQALRIPELITTQSGYQATGNEGLCILLRHLAYPNRLCDLEQVFQRSSSALSDIINFVNTHIYDECRHLLEDLSSLHWLNHNRLQQYAEVIVAKGARVPNCWGFIDGTIRPICRPSVEQEDYYSGHKRVHCVKYQSVVTPDGITVSELGAFEGRKHDAGMFRESGFYQQLEAKARLPNGNNFVIYGD
ncbi:hypothetical protein NQ314_006825 [Rhamnusium bicolor]|uniref:DDE Tnp4 domain-containing protein n=1 Tax=Rhamnusium bicolor TaxID=1586634 RepID=A0AAV8YY27_9CUCU|nr:hypothetical protein NQ314_006825 [Rhamnusium bicolor]